MEEPAGTVENSEDPVLDEVETLNSPSSLPSEASSPALSDLPATPAGAIHQPAHATIGTVYETMVQRHPYPFFFLSIRQDLEVHSQ